MSKRIIKKSEVNDMKNNIEAVSVAATDIVSSLKDVKYSFIDLASETETAISTLKTLKEITSLTATEFENLVSTKFVKGFTNSFAKGIEEVLSVLTSEIQNSMEVISQSLGLNLSSLSATGTSSSTSSSTSSNTGDLDPGDDPSKNKVEKRNPYENPFSAEKKSKSFLENLAKTLEKDKATYLTLLNSIKKSPSDEGEKAKIESLENDISGFEDMLENQKLHIAYVKSLPVTDKLHKQFLNMEKKYNLDKQKLEKLQLEQDRKKLRNDILANRFAESSIAQTLKLNSEKISDIEEEIQYFNRIKENREEFIQIMGDENLARQKYLELEQKNIENKKKKDNLQYKEDMGNLKDELMTSLKDLDLGGVFSSLKGMVFKMLKRVFVKFVMSMMNALGMGPKLLIGAILLAIAGIVIAFILLNKKTKQLFIDTYEKVANWVSEGYNKLKTYVTDFFNKMTELFSSFTDAIVRWSNKYLGTEFKTEVEKKAISDKQEKERTDIATKDIRDITTKAKSGELSDKEVLRLAELKNPEEYLNNTQSMIEGYSYEDEEKKKNYATLLRKKENYSKLIQEPSAPANAPAKVDTGIQTKDINIQNMKKIEEAPKKEDDKKAKGDTIINNISVGGNTTTTAIKQENLGVSASNYHAGY
jgi:hypothetical protein